MGAPVRQMCQMAAAMARRRAAVIEINVKCGQEGVQVVRHKMILDALRRVFRAATRASTRSDSVI